MSVEYSGTKYPLRYRRVVVDEVKKRRTIRLYTKNPRRCFWVNNKVIKKDAKPRLLKLETDQVIMLHYIGVSVFKHIHALVVDFEIESYKYSLFSMFFGNREKVKVD